MGREIDVRHHNVNRISPQRVTQLKDLARHAPSFAGMHALRIDEFDPVTGNPSLVTSLNAPAQKGQYVKRALEHVQSISRVLGLDAATQAPEFIADPDALTASSGAVTVHLQQRYQSIPIRGAAVAVRFDPAGAIQDTVGAAVTVDSAPDPAPALRVTDAVLKAAQHLATTSEPAATDPFGEPMPARTIDVGGFVPKIRATFANTPEQPTVLEPGPFGAEIKARQIWFPLDDRLALAWEILLTMPAGEGRYDCIVDAHTGELLKVTQTIKTVRAVGNVFRVDGGSARQLTAMPRQVAEYGLRIPSLGQDDWRWCSKCQGLHFGGHATHGVCPAGGAHALAGSGNYRLVDSAAGAPGQHDWRWCHKCEGLFFHGGGAAGVCPAGGGHDLAGSGNYSLANNSPLAVGQHGWRWCHKCQGLYFGDNATQGVCAAGGTHDSTGSGDYGLSHNAPALPSAFPDDWVSGSATVGNPVNAHLGASGGAMSGTVVDGVLTFNPTSATGDDQKVLNIFYYNGVMHDVFYALGFTEAAGNFQQDNLGRGGVATDRVDARSHSGAVWGTANMDTPVDGSAPTMNMGLVTSTNRHTAFDSTVVFHEFMHGVTNRLVGGPMNVHALDEPQSGGMGEGWGDYVACTINDVVVLGNWVLNNTGGIRGFPYDASFPDAFDRLGTGRYTESHNIGEIWCATLMEVNRRTDRNLAMQLVVDALKLSPANPSFLHMRDAIFKALDDLHLAARITGAQRDAAWQGLASTFARFGMGKGAASNGAQLTGIVGDFLVGQDHWRWCHKCESLYFGGHATQGHCAAGGAHDHTGSGNYDVIHNWPSAPGQGDWRWCHRCEAMSFAGHATQGVCPAGGAHDHAGSGAYKLVQNAPGAWGQNGWRWCRKCENLWFSGHATHGVCAAGGAHDSVGSGDYYLMPR